MQYQRPQVSEKETDAIRQLVIDTTINKGKSDVIVAMFLLAIENARLTAEVNDHRAARGFEPLPTFDVPK